MPARRSVAIMLDLQWPHQRHAGVFAGVQLFAKKRGWNSIIDEFAHETLASHKDTEPPYQGIIARANSALYRQATRWNIPVVNVWGSSPVFKKLPGVYPDFAAVGKHCAQHLLQRGFRTFAALTSQSQRVQRLVARAFNAEINQAGFVCQKICIPQNPWQDAATWRTAVETIKSCIKTWSPPIGVWVFEEGVGRLLTQECQQHHLNVPGDVAIIAGQNDLTLCEHPQPSLTSFDYGYERVGYQAASLLNRLMSGKSIPPEPIFLRPEGLVMRESTDFYVVDHPIVKKALMFIAENIHRDIGLDKVARAVRVEKRTLQNYFSNHLGRPIATEIRRIRIERAKRELATSDRTITEIAMETGFGDPMRMYDVFRRELGTTPSDYRKQRLLEAGS